MPVSCRSPGARRSTLPSCSGRGSPCPTASASALRPTRRPRRSPTSTPCSPPDTPGLAARARAALLAVPVPDDVAAAVTQAYAALGSEVPVAVRSSATAEDLPGASFAGQQDTYLNVVGIDAVLDAVRRCWASLWTDRAVAYRHRRGHRPRGHPARRRRAADGRREGRGRAVHRRPDQRPPHPQRRRRRAGAGRRRRLRFGRPRPLGRSTDSASSSALAPARAPASTTRRCGTLVELGRKVEAHFGAPQDIEWAFDAAGVLWLTQSRAITTLYPVPTAQRSGLRVYLNASLAQGLTRPITPMGLSAFRVVGRGAREHGDRRGPSTRSPDPPAFGRRGRPRVRRRHRGGAAAGRAPVPAAHLRRHGVPLGGRAARAPGRRARARGHRRPPCGRSPGRCCGCSPRFRVPPLVALASGAARPPRADKRRRGRGDRLRARRRPAGRRGRPRPASPTSSGRCSEAFAVMPSDRAGGGRRASSRSGSPARSPGPTSTRGPPTRCCAGCRTTSPRRWTSRCGRSRPGWTPRRSRRCGRPPAELADRYHAGALPAVLQRELTVFLAEHGHRTAAEIDLGMPRWSDDPTQVLGSLANYRAPDRRGGPPRRAVRPQRRGGREGGRRGRRQGPAPFPGPRAGHPLRAAPHPRARGHARDAQGLPRPAARARPRAARRDRHRAGRARPARRRVRRVLPGAGARSAPR